jgi:hypothetical protein
MPCPWLTTVTMVFCRASPVKVYVPSDRVSTAGRCEACWQGCPFYREAAEDESRELRSFDAEAQRERGVRTP